MTETRLTFPPLRQFLLGALFLLIAAAVPESAHAQLLVDLKLKKKTYVNYEAIEAEVAVHNRGDATSSSRVRISRTGCRSIFPTATTKAGWRSRADRSSSRWSSPAAKR
ncbi:MAG: hypothetical protein R3F11_04675 [Verrucomicrobiales bacterium]